MKSYTKQYQGLIARCWADDGYKRRLLADPITTLQEAGIRVPDGVDVKVVENSATALHLVIPQPSSDLDAANLASVSGSGSLETPYGSAWRVYDNTIGPVETGP